MELMEQFDKLGHKQLGMEQGIELLKQIQIELSRTQSSAQTWAFIAIVANATIIPLNVIINGCELKAAKGLYLSLVKALYDRHGKSGTRLDKNSKTIFKILRDVAFGELKRNGMSDLVPGVNIIFGFAEDSIVLMETAQMVSSGLNEIREQVAELNVRLKSVVFELMMLKIRRAEIFERVEIVSRTA